MQDNFPYHHPLYAGQMLKPPHEMARLAYMLSMWINPNNHALDGGRASSAMEKETVAEIIHPKKKIVASELAHYTHERISQVLGIKFQKIAGNKSGEMDLKKLEV